MHRRTAEFAQYCKAVYFDLEKQRSQHQDELIAALSTAGKPLTLQQWVRVTDYQWCLSPLCTAGSVKRIGGRFNIGQALAFIATPFPALYIAENAATAMSEYCCPPASSSALSQHELALRRPASFVNFSIEGQLSNVLDLRDLSALEDFVAIIRKFKLTRDTRQLARKYSLPARSLVAPLRTWRTKCWQLRMHGVWNLCWRTFLRPIRYSLAMCRRPGMKACCIHHSGEPVYAWRYIHRTSQAAIPICRSSATLPPERPARGLIARIFALMPCSSASGGIIQAPRARYCLHRSHPQRER